jgi:hypothetical protein
MMPPLSVGESWHSWVYNNLVAVNIGGGRDQMLWRRYADLASMRETREISRRAWGGISLPLACRGRFTDFIDDVHFKKPC